MLLLLTAALIVVFNGKVILIKYHIEVKLGPHNWVYVHKENKLSDAYHHIKTKMTEDGKYPIRVVRVERTVVFGDNQ